METRPADSTNEHGFSLVELLMAMTITLVIMGIATEVLIGALSIRTREDQKVDAIADVQRVLNIASREVANSGFGLLADNGLVGADCSSTSIRIRANLNAFSGVTGWDKTSDIKFYLAQTSTDSYLVRYDVNANDVTVLANRIDSFNVHYYNSKVTYNASGCDITGASASESAAYAQSGYIVLTACVKLPAIGSPGALGYHPASTVAVTSDVTLRNAAANLATY